MKVKLYKAQYILKCIGSKKFSNPWFIESSEEELYFQKVKFARKYGIVSDGIDSTLWHDMDGESYVFVARFIEV